MPNNMNYVYNPRPNLRRKGAPINRTPITSLPTYEIYKPFGLEIQTLPGGGKHLIYH